MTEPFSSGLGYGRRGASEAPRRPLFWCIIDGMEKIDEIRYRLLSRISVNASGCFIWQGCRAAHGYGATSYAGRQWLAHRLAYALFRGEIPDGMHVCHKCDTPACVNPSHLFLGTALKNRLDAKEKGRLPNGELHHKAKISHAIAICIRERYASGGVSAAALGAEYGISKTSVYDVIHERSWSLRPAT